MPALQRGSGEAWSLSVLGALAAQVSRPLAALSDTRIPIKQHLIVLELCAARQRTKAKTGRSEGQKVPTADLGEESAFRA